MSYTGWWIGYGIGLAVVVVVLLGRFAVLSWRDESWEEQQDRKDPCNSHGILPLSEKIHTTDHLV